MNNTVQKVKLPFQTRLKKRIDRALDRKKTIIWFLLIGTIIAFLIANFLPKYYRATGKIFLKYNSVHNSLLTRSGNIEKELELFESPEFLDVITEKLTDRNIEVDSREIQEFKELVVDDASAIIGLVVTSDNPQKATFVANAMLNEFFNTSILKNHSYLINALKIISDRETSLIESLNQGLTNTDSDLLTSLNLSEENLISQIAEFESELENIELDNQIYSFELNRLKSIFQNRFPTLGDEILYLNDENLKSILEQLRRMQSISSLLSVSRKLGGIQIQYLWPDTYEMDQFPQVEEEFFTGLDDYLENNYNEEFEGNEIFFKNLVRKLYEAQIKVDGIDITKSTIFNNINSLENRFNRIPFGKIEEARISRIKKFNNSLLIKIRVKKENLISLENNYYAEVDYLTEANIPESFFSPNITMITLVGALIGLVMGLLIAFKSSSVKIELIESANDLDEHGFKLLAQVPNFPPGSPILFNYFDENEENKTDPQISQAFSSIETFIKYGSLDKALKSVLIMSGQQGEGKSSISSNLAITLANSGNKVLLVDANLKYPILYKFFKVKSTPSIAHYLFRKKELNEIIRKTQNENLDLITCIEFPQNPAVILTSERMKNFVETVKKNYDYVIYDSCSLDVLAETAKLAALMDEVILVVRAGKTKLSQVLTLQTTLNDNGLFENEIILNDVKMKN